MRSEFSPGATPIDPDEAQGLLPLHITTLGELNRWEQDNIDEALVWLDATRPTDILTDCFVRELHKKMFCNVWRWAGEFRVSDKNLGIPWFHIPQAVRNLCQDARVWLERQDEPPDEMAVRLHHRLVSIHPFPNGNGRHARLMTDVWLDNDLDRPQFTWGGNDLSQMGETRQAYIGALEAADGGDLGPLLRFARS